MVNGYSNIKRGMKQTDVNKYCQWFIINDLHPSLKHSPPIATVSNTGIETENKYPSAFDNSNELKYVKYED